MAGKGAEGSHSRRGASGRALVGFVTIISVFGIGIGAWAIRPMVSPIPSTPGETELRLAAAAGIDLEGRTPDDNATRLLARVESGAAVDAASLSSVGGIIADDDGGIFTGYAFDRHDDGSVRTVYGVLEGRPAGQAIQWHAGGGIQRAWRYLDGRMVGQILERNTEGGLVLRAVCGPASPNGGTLVGEITLDDGNGAKTYSAGRFQWTSVGGSTSGVSEALRPDEIGSFMLFRRGWLGTETLLIGDGALVSVASSSD